VDSLIFRYNYSHHADVGHELKSRAWVNVIEYNRFSNESDGTASREIDLPNGGQAYLIGNVIQQGLQSQNSNLVGFGMEGLSNPGPHELYAVNNTMVNEKANGSFFQAPANAFFKAYGNILAGGGSFMSAWPTSIDTLGNLRATSIASVGFADASNYDYRIDASSPAHAIAYPAGVATGGYPLVAWYEYVHPVNGALRCQHATLDAGAFETCATDLREGAADGALLLPNPASDHARYISERAIDRLEVLDAHGRILRAWPSDGMRMVDLELTGYPAGVYVLHSLGASGATSLRFVKQ
jgi:hypothetical protein